MFLSLIPFVISYSFNQAQAPVTDAALKLDPRLNKVLSIRKHNIRLKDLLKHFSAELKTDGLLKLEENDYFFTIDINLKNIQIYDALVLVKELYDGEWFKEKDSYVLKMSYIRRRERDRWWNLYKRERDENFKRLADIKYKAFSVSGYGELFWPNVPEKIKTMVANNIDTEQYWKLKINIYGNFNPALDVITFPFEILESKTRDFLVNNVMEFQELQNSDSLKKDNILLISSQSVMKISLIKKDGKSIDSGLSTILFSSVNREFDKNNFFFLSGVIDSDLILQALQLDHKYLTNSINLIDEVNLGKKDSRVPKGWRELVEYQKKQFWQNSNDKKIAPLGLFPRRSQVLQKLSQNENFQYISDCYNIDDVGIGKSFIKPEELQEPLKIIEKYKSNWDVSVKNVKNIYMIRNNRWYRDDIVAVDPIFCNYIYQELQKIEKILDENEDAQKDKLYNEKFITLILEIAKKLDMKQICNGLNYFMPDENVYSKNSDTIPIFPLAYVSDFIVTNNKLIRFLLSLSEKQRSELMKNKLIIKNLDTNQISLISKMLPVYVDMENPYLNMESVSLVVKETLFSRAVYDLRTINSPVKLAAKSFDLVFHK